MKYKSFRPYSFIEYKCTELNKAMATTVHYSISQNLMQSFHLPEDALHETLKNWPNIHYTTLTVWTDAY